MTDEVKKEEGATAGEGTAGEVKPQEAAKAGAAKKEGATAEKGSAEEVKPQEAATAGAVKKEGATAEKGTAGEVKPQEAAKAGAAKKEETQKIAPPPKKEKPDKCEHCSKALGRVKWYYRDGGYYCTRRCWKEFKIKQEEEKKKAEAPAPA